MEQWTEQMKNQVNTLEKLGNYINVSDDERKAIETLQTKWGTTPYFASLMDKDDPNCPIRKQVIPSMKEQVNKHGMENYLVWKENRATEEVRPDSIARQYHDRIAFTVIDICAIYCRHCFRKELVVDQDLQLHFDVDEGLAWIAEHPEIRDAIRGHTTGLAQPMYVLATNIGKIPLMPDYYILDKNEKEYTLRNYKGEITKIPNVPE